MAQLHYLYEQQPIAIDTILRPVVLTAETPDYLGSLINLEDTSVVGVSQTSAVVIAQQFDQDILGDIVNAWNTFIQSGQVWALIIGLVIGYLIRGITAY
jgi:hypothetical protein